MNEDLLIFNKGMSPDVDVNNMQQGQYKLAENMMHDNSGNLVTEHGIEIIHQLPDGYKIVGRHPIEGDLIIASTNGTDSEIGILSGNTYTSIVNNTVLGFIPEHSVHIEYKKDFLNNRVIYIAGKGIKLRAIDLDNIPDSSFDSITSLFLEYDLPTISYDGVSTGGSVLSGSYQFAARLVTAGNNATAFGPISDIVPIVLGTDSTSRKDVEGAIPQTVTSKAITMSVGNIDTAFEYIEVCMITYTGQANVLKLRSLGLQPISGRESISLTYTGESDETGTILEEEISIDGTSYESAEYITQKDNTLDIAGLTEKDDTVDWQSVANSIVLKYVTHDLEHSEEADMVRDGDVYWSSLSDNDKQRNAGDSNLVRWEDVNTGGTKNDFVDPIKCSKFRGYRRGEVYSFTFTPIFKGGRRGDAYHIPSLTSSEVSALGVSTDNLLSVAKTANTTYPEGFGNLTNQLVRYHRFPDNGDSTYYKTEGSTEYIVPLGVETIIAGDKSWESDLDGYVIGRENRSGKETITAQGISKDLYSINNDKNLCFAPSFGNCSVEGTDRTNITNDSSYSKRIVTFHSPDIDISPNLSYVPTKIRRVYKLTGRYAYANTGNSSRKKGYNLVYCYPGSSSSYGVRLIDGAKSINTASDSLTDDYREKPGDVNLSLNLFNNTVLYRRTLECLAIQGDEDIPRNRDFVEYYSDDGNSTDANYRLNNLDDFEVDLYNLEVERSELYGDVYNKESLPVNTVLFREGSFDPRDDKQLDKFNTVSFGGDTYISRYSIVFKTTGAFLGSAGNDQDIPCTQSIVYIMVESNNNYNFRHSLESTESSTYTSYYPKDRILQADTEGLLRLPVAAGIANQYNKQYSLQGLLKQSYTKDVGQDVVTSFRNRIAYSATSIEGEKFDAYRLFLPANYHDIPKQYGGITGIFVMGNDFMVHTERSLWRSFFNTLATQATSAGDIVLGNGGAFNRPSVPVISTEGGYAGCKDILASVGTPMGRFFYDTYACKLFFLGDGLQEISNQSIENTLRENLYSKDVVLGYDSDRKRVIMSSNDLTLSYKPNMSCFSSIHSYSFGRYVNSDIRNIALRDNLIGQYTKNLIGNYFGTISNSRVVVPSVVSPNISKRYVSLFVVSSAKDPISGLQKPYKIFDTMTAYSEFRNTGPNTLQMVKDYVNELETLGTVLVHRVNDKFRMDIPPDLVDDIEKDIFDVTNLKTHSRFDDLERMYLPDMIGKHIVFDMVINNSDNAELKLLTINANFEQNID